jgi:phosphopantetheinyl transferase (holo-ACP synthase)
VKALGLSGGFGLHEVEVVGSEPPRLRLSGRAARAAAEQGVELSVSLTHAREFAAAVALAERSGRAG